MALIVAPPAAAQEAAAPLRVVSQGPGTLYRADPTVQFVVHSEKAGRDYLVQVTPPAFGPWLPGQKAAVAYVLDGGYGIMGPTARLLGGSNAMLPAYVVTVAYPAGQPSSRERDMLFATAVRPDGSKALGGGAEAFMGFIVDELRPWVEAKYPVDRAKSVLMGHSQSGIFTANVLARRPDAFASYLIASPSVWAQPDIAERLARVSLQGPPRRVFVAYGEDEAPHMVSGGRQVARALARNKAAVVSRSEVFAGADHISFYPELAARGLGYLLPRKRPINYPNPTPVPAETLRRYEGVYVLSDGRRLPIALKGGKLATTLAFPVELDALPRPGRFFVNGVDVQFTFEGPPDGPAQLLRIDYLGEVAVARRAP
ncbi:alpha/beta hydrolase [Phenylobacterium sp.]|uniref:alpha/beta hydrolase n=1 Tax=Phenylobacterium sp. TaxID=1871053 RepID=UPI002F93B5F8